jgi:hypothetical protein
MRAWHMTLLLTIIALTCLVTPPIGAGEHSGHMMVTPVDLQWTDIPSLPGGAKLAVTESGAPAAPPLSAGCAAPLGYILTSREIGRTGRVEKGL